MKCRSSKDVRRRMEQLNKIRRRPAEANFGKTSGGVVGCGRCSHVWLRQSGLGRVERRVDLRADGGDRADADHNDQGQHHGVLDSGRAIFRRQKLLQKVHGKLAFSLMI